MKASGISRNNFNFMPFLDKGDVTVTAQFSTDSHALSYNGENSVVEIDFDSTLDLDEIVTVEAWVRKNSAQSGTIAVAQRHGAFHLFPMTEIYF